MPEILRSASLLVQHEIGLPMSPPIVVTGKGKDGKNVCQLFINATGVAIAGPKGGVIREMNWEQLIQLAQE
jgi:hypothetical protein